VADLLEREAERAGRTDLEWTRKRARELWRGWPGVVPEGNLFGIPERGAPAEEEDSPGNYAIREHDGGIEYVRYDEHGEPTVVSRFGEPLRRIRGE
jgi:hypothetical protein